MSKKTSIIVIISALVVAIAITATASFAFWTTTKVQTDTNVITSGCFNLSLTGENKIDLAKQYPISDTSGMDQTPYTFTITNNCATEESYQVNLEALAATTFQTSSIKVAIDNSYKTYDLYTDAAKYYDTSVASKKLASGTLASGNSVTYNLRLWIDANAPTTEQNKRFETKIVVDTAVTVENGPSVSGGGEPSGD